MHCSGHFSKYFSKMRNIYGNFPLLGKNAVKYPILAFPPFLFFSFFFFVIPVPFLHVFPKQNIFIPTPPPGYITLYLCIGYIGYITLYLLKASLFFYIYFRLCIEIKTWINKHLSFFRGRLALSTNGNVTCSLTDSLTHSPKFTFFSNINNSSVLCNFGLKFWRLIHNWAPNILWKFWLGLTPSQGQYMLYKIGMEIISLRIIFKHKYLVILSDDLKFWVVKKFLIQAIYYGCWEISVKR